VKKLKGDVNMEKMKYSIGYKRCLKIVEKAKEKNKEEIHIKKLLNYINMYLGSDERTEQKYLKALIGFGFVKYKGEGIYTIK